MMPSTSIKRERRRSVKNGASLSGDWGSKSQTSYKDSKLGYSSGESTELEQSIRKFDTENLYRCTLPGCNSSWGSQNEWKMHEEGHWTPKCYFCPFCATLGEDPTGDRWCIGCSHKFDSRFDVVVAGSHVLQCDLARERTQKFESDHHLFAHLRNEHDVKISDLQIALCSFPVVSNWPRECGFCDTKFIQWDEREDHIGAHFLRANNLSEDSSQSSHMFKIDLSGMAEHDTNRYYPRDAWNTTCISKQGLRNTIMKTFEVHNGVEITFPEDCPALVTDTAEGNCSCNGTLPSVYSKRTRLRSISRALHFSRAKLLLRATGEWLFFTPEFEKWRNLHEHSFLWLRGSPGSGKSLLTSAVIRYLEEGDKRDGEILTFYCCDGRFESLHTVLNIMGTWLTELQARRTSNYVIARLMESLIYLENTPEELSLAVLRRAFQIIKHSLKEEETLILVLDGLEDYQMGYDLLQELLTLTSEQGEYHRVKILLSSTTDFTKDGRNFTPLEVNIDTGTSIMADMKDYTESVVSKSLVSQSAITTIWNLIENSQGRFLCLRLLLLIFTYGSASVDKITKTLSITDDESIKGPVTIYNRIFRSIPQHYHQFATSILRWVLHAARPMYSWELLDAVNAELGTDYLDTDIEKATMGLLTISRSRTVNLVHLNLRDYFMSIEGNQYTQETQEIITKACLRALPPTILLQCFHQPWSDGYASNAQPPKESQTLETYAKVYLIHHYLIAEPQSTCIAGLLHEIVKKILPARKAMPRNNINPKSEASKTLLEIKMAQLELVSLDAINLLLQIAASSGLYELAKLELDMGATINSFPKNPLRLAAMAGHTRLVELFLEYGADITSCYGSDDTPLFHAIAGGHYEVANLLVKAEASQAAEISRPLGVMDELRLVPAISHMSCGCEQIKIIFMITKNVPSNTSEKMTSHIFIKEDIYLPPSLYRDLTTSGNTNDATPIKWFPGTSMYRALALAANLGNGHVREILLVAGNTLDPFEKMVSFLSRDFAMMAIAEH